MSIVVNPRECAKYNTFESKLILPPPCVNCRVPNKSNSKSSILYDLRVLFESTENKTRLLMAVSSTVAVTGIEVSDTNAPLRTSKLKMLWSTAT